MRLLKTAAAAMIAALILAAPAQAARIKDIVSVSGMRQNQLIGYGLMVGLKNTGDKASKSPFTAQTLIAMLKRLGTTVDVTQLSGPQVGTSQTRYLRDLKTENAAAVMVTASLPPFAKPGQKLDISVSSLGDAKSLEGGTLLLTPLKAANGETYAVAQGTLAVTRKPSKKTDRAEAIPTQGIIPNGAIVEKEVPTEFASKSQFTLLLDKPDFATASAIVAAVNQKFGDNAARGLDAGTVELNVPAEQAASPFGFISEVEQIAVKSDMPAKVVLDEKSGTVIIGDHVEVNNVAISFADITLRIRKDQLPAGKEPVSVIRSNANINELIAALNAMGVSPQDLVAIFRALHASGALNAELEVL
ncbi:MAG: flagellar basal body P-ring protein FlgI [Nitrospinae bacterium]|nr:flagellar basal body P-ring protein FlgI [Nitrospinota bacterium]